MRKFIKLVKFLIFLFIIGLLAIYFAMPDTLRPLKNKINSYYTLHKNDGNITQKCINKTIYYSSRTCHKLVTLKSMSFAYYYVYKGDRQYSKKNLIGAINYYNYALKIYPAHAKANYNLANILAIYEDYVGALEHYEAAVKYHPKFFNARIALGILLSEKFFDYDRAIKEYQTAIDNAPWIACFPVSVIYNNKEYVVYNKSAAYYNMGLAYKWKSLVYGQDKFEETTSLNNAAKAYENAIKWKKDAYDAYFNLALTYQLLEKKEQSKQYYCKCINMHPFDYDAHYNLAVLLRSQDNFLDAMLELEKAALIMDFSEDSYLTRYIYDVLSETTAKLYAQEDYKTLIEKLDNSPLMSYKPTFVNGKIVASEELDEAMVKNMKICHACDEPDGED